MLEQALIRIEGKIDRIEEVQGTMRVDISHLSARDAEHGRIMPEQQKKIEAIEQRVSALEAERSHVLLRIDQLPGIDDRIRSIERKVSYFGAAAAIMAFLGSVFGPTIIELLTR